jgi:hypothetical protein
MSVLTADNWIEFIITECQDYQKGEMTQRGLISDLVFIVSELKKMTQTETDQLIEFMIAQKNN